MLDFDGGCCVFGGGCCRIRGEAFFDGRSKQLAEADAGQSEFIILNQNDLNRHPPSTPSKNTPWRILWGKGVLDQPRKIWIALKRAGGAEKNDKGL